MATNNENQKGSQGTGSAEQTGRPRSDQQQQTEFGKEEKGNLAQQANVDASRLASQKELGADSGRDDYAGGSGNVMDDQNTGQRTDR